MKKKTLTERFKELAGLKPLYEQITSPTDPNLQTYGCCDSNADNYNPWIAANAGDPSMNTNCDDCSCFGLDPITGNIMQGNDWPGCTTTQTGGNYNIVCHGCDVQGQFGPPNSIFSWGDPIGGIGFWQGNVDPATGECGLYNGIMLYDTPLHPNLASCGSSTPPPPATPGSPTPLTPGAGGGPDNTSIGDPCEEFEMLYSRDRRAQEDFCRECYIDMHMDPMCRCCDMNPRGPR